MTAQGYLLAKTGKLHIIYTKGVSKVVKVGVKCTKLLKFYQIKYFVINSRITYYQF